MRHVACTKLRLDQHAVKGFPVQALQDILDDDDDIGSMYLSRKARAKQRSQAAVSQDESAPAHGGDDEVLVAHAEEEVCVDPNITIQKLRMQTASSFVPLEIVPCPSSGCCVAYTLCLQSHSDGLPKSCRWD